MIRNMTSEAFSNLRLFTCNSHPELAQEIAEHMELKVGAICDYTRDVREAKTRTERHKYDADVIRLYNAGKTYKQIGEAVGISPEHVSQILSRLRDNGKVGRRNKLWRGR